MTGAADFSVVIPTHNCGRYLPRAVASVLAQDLPAELVVVDDGSTDGTPGLMARYGPRVRYLRRPHRGPGAARNQGIAAATGAWLVLLDADDMLLPGALRRLRGAIDAHPEVDLVQGGWVCIGARGRRRRRPRLGPDPIRNFRAYVTGRLELPHGSAAVRRSALGALRYPESIRNFEDVVLKAQLLARCRAVAFGAPVVEIHDRPNRLRDNLRSIEAAGVQAVALLFDPRILPPSLLSLRRVFWSQLLLWRARAHYRAADYAGAEAFYRQAFRLRPTNVLRPAHLRKFFRAARRGASARNAAAGATVSTP